MSIEIRSMQLSDEAAVADICFVTSGWGRDGKQELFNLIAMRWCQHYVRYETPHCHVAVDTKLNDQVVGYLLCAPDTVKQDEEYAATTLPLLKAEIKRLRPKAGVERLQLEKEFMFLPAVKQGPRMKAVLKEYPAHIHIDIYPSHHRRGIGRMLFDAHEAHLRAIGCPGYHLGVGSGNQQAVKFYTAMQMTDLFHQGGPLDFGVIFVKKI